MSSALDTARSIIKEQEQELERLNEPARGIGTVMQLLPPDILLSTSQGLVLVKTPPKYKLKVGDRVALTESGAILAKITNILPLGSEHTVLDCDESTARIERAGQKIVVSLGTQTDVQTGDKLILDDAGLVAIKSVRVERAKPTEVAVTTWDDIGGQDAAKQALREAVELPVAHPELFAKYNKAPVKGVLLYGPPGCGKTMLGRALATSLGAGFIYVKGPELLDSFVGQSEANVREIFADARRYKQETQRPAVVFIDECDALLGVRGAHFSGMEKTIVPMFLTEMDGLEESAAIVVLATNRPDQLDPAVTREGRIDRKIKVARPDAKTTTELFAMYFKSTFCALSPDDLANHAGALLHDEAALPMYEVHTDQGAKTFHLRHLVSGALVANIVEQASARALTRDIDSGDEPSGVNVDDLLGAIEAVYHQNRDLHHDEAISEFTGYCTIHKKEKLHAASA